MIMSTMTPAPAGPIAQYHDEEAWLEFRKTGIGGSEIAAIFGEHPFITAQELWERKTGRAGETEVTLPMIKGRYMEDPAAEYYSEVTGRRLRRQPTRRHPDHPFLLASVDRQVLAGPDNPTMALEIKVPGWRTVSEVRRLGLRPYMILQAELEALVWGYDFTAFALLDAGHWNLIHFDHPADPGTQEMIINEAGEWWEKYVITDTPPPEQVRELPKDLPTVEGEMVQRTDAAWEEAARAWVHVKGIFDEAKELEGAARSRLRDLMKLGAAEGAGVRCYLRANPGKRTFQQKNLAAVRPVDREKLIGILTTKAGITTEQAAAVADTCALDLDDDRFFKVGAAYETFTPYVLQTEED